MTNNNILQLYLNPNSKPNFIQFGFLKDGVPHVIQFSLLNTTYTNILWELKISKVKQIVGSDKEHELDFMDHDTNSLKTYLKVCRIALDKIFDMGTSKYPQGIVIHLTPKLHDPVWFGEQLGKIIKPLFHFNDSEYAFKSSDHKWCIYSKIGYDKLLKHDAIYTKFKGESDGLEQSIDDALNFIYDHYLFFKSPVKVKITPDQIKYFPEINEVGNKTVVGTDDKKSIVIEDNVNKLLSALGGLSIPIYDEIKPLHNINLINLKNISGAKYNPITDYITNIILDSGLHSNAMSYTKVLEQMISVIDDMRLTRGFNDIELIDKVLNEKEDKLNIKEILVLVWLKDFFIADKKNTGTFYLFDTFSLPNYMPNDNIVDLIPDVEKIKKIEKLTFYDRLYFNLDKYYQLIEHSQKYNNIDFSLLNTDNLHYNFLSADIADFEDDIPNWKLVERVVSYCKDTLKMVYGIKWPELIDDNNSIIYSDIKETISLKQVHNIKSKKILSPFIFWLNAAFNNIHNKKNFSFTHDVVFDSSNKEVLDSTKVEDELLFFNALLKFNDETKDDENYFSNVFSLYMYNLFIPFDKIKESIINFFKTFLITKKRYIIDEDYKSAEDVIDIFTPLKKQFDEILNKLLIEYNMNIKINNETSQSDFDHVRNFIIGEIQKQNNAKYNHRFNKKLIDIDKLEEKLNHSNTNFYLYCKNSIDRNLPGIFYTMSDSGYRKPIFDYNYDYNYFDSLSKDKSKLTQEEEIFISLLTKLSNDIKVNVNTFYSKEIKEKALQKLLYSINKEKNKYIEPEAVKLKYPVGDYDAAGIKFTIDKDSFIKYIMGKLSSTFFFSPAKVTNAYIKDIESGKQVNFIDKKELNVEERTKFLFKLALQYIQETRNSPTGYDMKKHFSGKRGKILKSIPDEVLEKFQFIDYVNEPIVDSINISEFAGLTKGFSNAKIIENTFHQKGILNKFKEDIKQYTSSSYEEINSIARSDKANILNEFNIKYSKILIRLFSGFNFTASRLIKNTTVYRGSDSDKWLSNNMVNDIVIEPGFFSTTISPSVMYNFSNKNSGNLYFIYLPKGTPGIYIGNESSHAHENELLLPPGSMFRILKIENRKKSPKNELKSLDAGFIYHLIYVGNIGEDIIQEKIDKCEDKKTKDELQKMLDDIKTGKITQ